MTTHRVEELARHSPETGLKLLLQQPLNARDRQVEEARCRARHGANGQRLDQGAVRAETSAMEQQEAQGPLRQGRETSRRARRKGGKRSSAAPSFTPAAAPALAQA